MTDITPQKPIKNKYKRIHDDIYSSDEEFTSYKKF